MASFDGVNCGRGFDPTEDTESDGAVCRSSIGSGAAEASIRLRILKVYAFLPELESSLGGRGFDPTEDTESV